MALLLYLPLALQDRHQKLRRFLLSYQLLQGRVVHPHLFHARCDKGMARHLC